MVRRSKKHPVGNPKSEARLGPRFAPFLEFRGKNLLQTELVEPLFPPPVALAFGGVWLVGNPESQNTEQRGELDRIRTLEEA